MATSPSTDNYRIGKGICRFKRTGAGTFRDMGNSPAFEFTPELEELEHETSRSGIRSVDKTVVVSKKGTLAITLDEWSADNIALALLDDTYSGSGAIEIFGGSSVTGEVLFTDTNEVGEQYEWHFLNVTFIPSAALGLISDEWGQIELNGRVGVNGAGSFGTATPIVAT